MSIPAGSPLMLDPLEMRFESEMAAASELARREQWPRALDAGLRALQAADACGAGCIGLAARRALLLLLLAQIQSELGSHAEAMDATDEVLSIAGNEQPALCAVALVQKAQLFLRSNRVREAAEQLDQAFEVLPANDDALRARALLARATQHAFQGDVAASRAENAAALALLELPAHRALVRERYSAIMNRAASAFYLGHLDEALAPTQRAFAIASGMLAGGSSGREIDLARQQLNLAGIHANRKDFAVAVRAYTAALRWITAALRRRPGAPVHRLLSALRAKCTGNLAFCHFQAGSLKDAAAWMRKAIDQYRAVPPDIPLADDDRARAWVNLGHIEFARQRCGSAVKAYEVGMLHFRHAVEHDRPHLAYDLANAQFGLARALTLAGDLARAGDLFDTAAESMAAVVHAGQLQHAAHWIEAWQQQAQGVLNSGADAAEPFVGRLLLWLDKAPLRRALSFEAPWRVLQAGVEQLVAWQARCRAAPQRLAWFQVLVSAFLLHLLSRAADLLGNADPDALRRHETGLTAVSDRLLAVALEAGADSALPAEWFLHTHGLRAQRNALAGGDSPELVALRAMLGELQQTEETLLGASAPALNWAAGAQARPSEEARWRELHERCEERIAVLTAASRLPRSLRLDSDAVVARLAPGQAVLLVARHLEHGLIVIAIGKADDGQQAFRHAASALPAGLRQTNCEDLNTLVRGALAGRTLGAVRRAAEPVAPDGSANLPAPEQAVQIARRYHAALFELAVLPMLNVLAGNGQRDVSLIPSADLHWLPWLDAAETRPTGVRLAIYPTLGAWANATTPDMAATEEPLRWALLASNADELRWAGVECRAAGQLWQHRLRTVCAAELPVTGVDALLAVGHGAAPQGNLARAGLLLSGDRVFDAHGLAQVQRGRQVVMSCCVAGCIDEVIGEAMGFLSGCFAYDTRFGCGWLIEVPDIEACLFSLALQYALHQAQTAAGGMDWLATFEAVRRGIQAGAWPERFGAWLAHVLPDAIAATPAPAHGWLDRYELMLAEPGGGLFNAPPPSLRLLMPWIVGLGR